jgi:enoyl-CoA hydratase
MEYRILNLKISEKIATVTISRPEALNALNSRFFEEMDAMIAEVNGNKDVRVMIITGAGKAFVAGADIAEMVDMGEAQGTAFSKTGQNTFRSLEKMDIPVIAAINGFVLGGGCELALACDIRVASEKAKFGQPEVNLGLIPGYAATQRLPRLIGLGNALYLLLSGEMIGAEEALRMGLVQKVVAPEELEAAVLDLAKLIAGKGPQAVRLAKMVAREGLLNDFEAGCALESEKFGSLFENEGREGMRAFLEKRAPKW